MSVFVPSSRNRNVSVYHTTRCKNVEKMDSVLETTEQEAQKRDLTLCKHCDPDANPNEGVEKDFSYFMAAKKAGEQAD